MAIGGPKVDRKCVKKGFFYFAHKEKLLRRWHVLEERQQPSDRPGSAARPGR